NHDGTVRLTRSGVSIGTPEYMSPEQAAGDPNVDARTDIYALGVVLYEMLTGRRPFTGLTPQAIFAKVMSEDPPSLSSQRRTVPPHMEEAVRRSLEKLPADRWQSASAFVEALTGGATARLWPGKRLRTTRRGSWAPWLLSGALALTLAGILLWKTQRAAS